MALVRKREFIAYVVAILVAVIGAIGGRFYDDIRAWISPEDDFAGTWVGLAVSTKPGEPMIAETINLDLRDGVVSGLGTAGNKSWNYTGYRRSPNLVLAYRSAQPGGFGFGTLFLADNDGNGTAYVGHLEGNFCPAHKVFRCPYLLAKGQRDSPEVAAIQARYAEVLSGQCVAIAEFACLD